MGACGCGEYGGEFQFPGPDGSIYSLEVYTGCENCDEGPGIIIHHHVTDEGKMHWDPESQLPLPFRQFGDGDSEAAVQLVDLDEFRASIHGAASDLDTDVAEELKYELSRDLESVVDKTLEKFRARVRKTTS